MSVEQALAQFKETEGGEAFRLQNSKLLEGRAGGIEIQAKLGSMVAYQGDVQFEHAGSGGLGEMLKKAVTSEGTQLMKIAGTGEVFLADMAQDVQLIQLENDTITANGANLLAFDAGIDWDIKRVEGVSGMLGGGLYNMELKGTGWSRSSPTARPCCSRSTARHVRRPAGGDHLVERSTDLGQDRRQHQDLDRQGIGRDVPDAFSGRAGCWSSRPRGGSPPLRGRPVALGNVLGGSL